jgi:acetyl esterase/lipase
MRKYENCLARAEKLLSGVFCFLLLITIHLMPAGAQQTEQQSVFKTDYLIYLPADYNTNQDKSWPLMIYLHGAGLKDRSLKGLKDDYLPWHLDHDKVLPFIVVSPVCNTNGWNTTILNLLLDDLVVKYKVDKDKIYVTGHSMGGFGTWNWAVENPERFAAIVPVSGCSNATDSISAWKLRNMPVWVFHGDMDKIVDIRCNIEMVKELEKFSKKVKFTVYPGRGHDTWEQTFSNDEMYKWLLKQDRKNNVPIAVQLDKKIYEAYAGRYIFDQDTITLEYSGGQLYIKPTEGNLINLISESERIFTFKENPSFSIIFQKENNKLTGFIVPGNGNKLARRIETTK